MLRLEDFPEAKVEKFGGDFVKVTQRFCEEHSLKMNNFPEDEIIKVFSKTLSRHMIKSTKWHVRPAKTQISLGICPV